MPTPHYQRFAISTSLRRWQHKLKRSARSKAATARVFREAVRFYMNAGRTLQPPRFVMPTNEEERKDNPFRLFAEWNSEADAAYDSLR